MPFDPPSVPGGGGPTGNNTHMNRLHRFLLTLSLTSATVLVAQSDSDAGTRGRHRGHAGGLGLPPVFLALDIDKNGEISSAELASAPLSLKALDVNDDGIYSAEELRLAHLNASSGGNALSADGRIHGARPRPALPLMLALDANADGIISAPEIANAVASLRALDADGDGALTHAELRPLPPARS